MQGFRYCTASADLVIVSVHHTGHGAFRVVKANPNTPLAVYKFPQPWALAKGDSVPNAGVVVQPEPYKRRRRKRIGE